MKDRKFRAWDVIGNKWVFGDLVHNQKVTTTGLEPRVMVGGYEVSPDSVGLFTGLHDKKGREIYEGDIIFSKFTDGSSGYLLVGWNENEASFGVINAYSYQSKKKGYDISEFLNYVLLAHLHNAAVFEVAGNIIQNEELLNV